MMRRKKKRPVNWTFQVKAAGLILTVLVIAVASGCMVRLSETGSLATLPVLTNEALSFDSISTIDTQAVGQRVVVRGSITALRRLQNGSAQLELTDQTGTITVFLDRTIAPDLLTLSVDLICEIAGPVQIYRDNLEIKPTQKNDIKPIHYDFQPVEVESVVDGDTIHVLDTAGNRLTVRVIGIDCPELGHDQQFAEPWAEEAKARTAALLLNQTVFMEKDHSDTDQYDRLLRYIWLEQPEKITEETVCDFNLSAILMADGLAVPVVFGSDDKYAGLLEQLGREARADGKGLWRSK